MKIFQLCFKNPFFLVRFSSTNSTQIYVISSSSTTDQKIAATPCFESWHLSRFDRLPPEKHFKHMHSRLPRSHKANRSSASWESRAFFLNNTLSFPPLENIADTLISCTIVKVLRRRKVNYPVKIKYRVKEPNCEAKVGIGDWLSIHIQRRVIELRVNKAPQTAPGRPFNLALGGSWDFVRVRNETLASHMTEMTRHYSWCSTKSTFSPRGANTQ